MNTLDQVYIDQRSTAGSYNTQQRLLLIMIGLVDMVALALASAVSYALRYALQLEVFQDSQISQDLYLGMVAVLLPAWVILFAVFQL